MRRLVETCREHGVFNQDVDTALGIMRRWYNGCRFATEAETDLYNSDIGALLPEALDAEPGGAGLRRGAAVRPGHRIRRLDDLYAQSPRRRPGIAFKRQETGTPRRQRRQKVGVSSISTLYTSSRPVSMAKLSHHFTASG